MEMCRLCLVTDNPLMEFDDCFVTNYNLLTHLNVTLHDDLPQYSCQNCAEAVNFFIEFKRKCNESENYLREQGRKIKLEESITLAVDDELNICNTIKSEYDSDAAEDSEYFNNDENFILETSDTQMVDEFCIKNEEFEEDKRTLIKKRRIKKRSCNIKSKVNEGQVTNKKSLCNNNKKIIEVPEETALLCGICRQKFEEASTLKTHLETHKTNKHCELCDEKVWSWPRLFSHRLEHLPSKQKKCHICDRRIASSRNLEYHYLKHHNEGQEKLLKCTQCESAFGNPRKLSRHVRYAHSELKFVCDYCSKAYSMKCNLIRHIVFHSTVKSFTCELCAFACKSRMGLKNHVLYKHTPNRVICKQCSRIFANQEKCDRHTCKLKVKICPVCGMQLGPKMSLPRHMQTHNKVAAFKCELCPAVYKRKPGLLTHMKKHNGIRDKKCEFCPAKFLHSSVLTKHRRIHTGEKPYVCKVCSKSFTGNNNLKVHMRVHGEFIINKKNKDDNDST
ncbi:unnamed protein product [Diatraea saccharalis]|uniref:C2H2-type domain-containing protein n=1 Tax=Diatraea saccharalis TaxID=40085 RepID=A0A9N9WBQ8_9NEOP|nr:unnamed protein product [Diatraea saccharalis]